MSPRTSPRLLLPLVLLVPLAGSARAQGSDGDSWSWRVAPYLWTTSIDGSVTKPIGEADFDVDFGDIWDNLESAGLLFVETRRDRLSLLGDLIYLGLEVDGETSGGTDADLALDTTILELAGLYRLAPESPYELGLGMRYAYMDSELEIGALSSDGSRDTLDGFAAARATWPIAGRCSAQVYGDVGAGEADLIWQASALLALQFEGWGLAFGYRVLDYDIEEGADELDLAFEGLMYGVEFRF